MTDPRRMPVGATSVRKDGKAWKKVAHGEDFKYVGVGGLGGQDQSQALTPGHAWKAIQRALKLDGHLPHESIHPSHVQFDMEGDVDTKPVLTWTDHAGNVHNTYTEKFHWSKANHHTAQSKKYSEAIEKAFNLAELTLEASAGTDPTDALICTHLSTGHRVNDLLKMRGSHASVDGGANFNPSKPIFKSDHVGAASVTIHGVDIKIEQPAGSVREGVDEFGKPWSQSIPYHYGSVVGVTGADGEDLDVIINPHGESDVVVLVEQLNRAEGEFDEYKVLLNFESVSDAITAYQAMYPIGHYGGHIAVSKDVFRDWVNGGASGKIDSKFIIKSYNSYVPHPHRVTLVATHKHGHVYPTQVVNQHVADYVMQHKDPAGPLFNTTREAVDRRLQSLGVGHVSESDVRHIATRRMAADILSKMGDVNLASDGGLEQFQSNVRTASDEIATRLGHPPAAEGMSYVHPHVVLAYAEQCNGAALWPKVFNKSESCASPNQPDNSSLEATISRTVALPTSTSPTTALEPEPQMPTRSPKPSPMIRGRLWWEVADQVEESLGRPQYRSRLPPLPGSEVPRYSVEPSVDDVIVGTVVTINHDQWRVVSKSDGANCCTMRRVLGDGLESDFYFEEVGGKVVFALKTDKSLTQADYANFKRIMDSTKPKKNWKVGRAIMQLSGLARKARKGDLDAAAALRNLIDLINNSPDHGFDVPVSKGEFESPEAEDDADVVAFFHHNGSITLHISKADDVPGPQGDPVGTVREHADGSRWEKRDDGWHEVSDGTRNGSGDNDGVARGAGGAPQGEGTTEGPTRSGSAVYQQSVAVMARLKAMYDATSDPEEKKLLAEQIAIVRNRIAMAEKTLDAGTIQPENRTRERKVTKSDIYGEVFPALKSAASRHIDYKSLCSSILMRGTPEERAELKALAAEHQDEAHSIVKGWLR